MFQFQFFQQALRDPSLEAIPQIQTVVYLLLAVMLLTMGIVALVLIVVKDKPTDDHRSGLL